MCWGINVPFIELLLAFNIRIYLVQYFFYLLARFSRLEKGIIIFFISVKFKTYHCILLTGFQHT